MLIPSFVSSTQPLDLETLVWGNICVENKVKLESFIFTPVYLQANPIQYAESSIIACTYRRETCSKVAKLSLQIPNSLPSNLLI